MIIDVTGTVLTPGNDGKDCLGNGSHYDEFGNLIEICCEQCDYFLCCNAKNNKLIAKSAKMPYALGILIK